MYEIYSKKSTALFLAVIMVFSALPVFGASLLAEAAETVPETIEIHVGQLVGTQIANALMAELTYPWDNLFSYQTYN